MLSLSLCMCVCVCALGVAEVYKLISVSIQYQNLCKVIFKRENAKKKEKKPSLLVNFLKAS